MAFGGSNKRIAGITIELGADTTKLTTALKGLDKELSGSKANLKDINNLLKLNPGNVTLLAQKQKELQTSIAKTKDRLSELKSVSKDSVTPEQWDTLQREIIDTENQLKNLEKEYKNFSSVAVQQVKAAGEKMQEIGGKIGDVGKTLTQKVTAPIAAVGALGLKSFAEVDKTMQLTNKTMGNTAEEAETLNAAMKEAAANSVYGMSDAATATLNFARAGLDANEAAAALAPTMNLAAGEGGDLDTVSSGLVATINGFHGSFDEAATYADIFAAACNNSALDVNTLSEAMSVAAPTFSAGGYAVKDAALYLGIMANAGVDANKAANSLKTGFMRLVDPPDEAAAALDKLGVSVVNADGSMKDTLIIQKDLNKAFRQLSESEQLAAASAIFGKNQAAPWLALINTATPDVEKLNAAIKDSAGTTDEMAEAMMGGFGGAIEQLKSSLDVLIYSIGEQLAPYAMKVVGVVQKVTTWLNKLSPRTKKIVTLVGTAAAAIGPLLLGVSGIISLGGKALETLAPVLPAIKGGLGAITGLLTGPAGIVLGVGAVIAIVLKATGVWDKLKASLIDAWPKIQEGAAKAWDLLVAKIGEFKTFVHDNFIAPLQGLYEASIKPVFDQIAAAFEPVKKSAAATWNVIEGILNGWNSFGDLRILLGDLWENLTAFGAKVGSILAGVDWAGIGRQALEIFKSGFKVAGDWIKSLVLGDDFTPDSTWADVGGKIWNTITTGISAVGDWIKGLVLGDEYTPDASWSQVGGKLWDNVKAGFAVVGDWIKALVLGDEYTPDSTWGDVGGKLWGAVTAGFTAAGDWIKSIVLGDEYTPDASWSQVGGKIWGKITEGLASAIEWLSTLFTGWTAKLTDGSVDFSAIGASMWTAITSAFSGAVTWFANLFGGTSDTDTKSVKGAVASIDWAGLGSSILGLIGGAFSGIADFYKGYFIEVWNSINGLNWAGLGKNMWSAIKKAFKGITSWFKETFKAPINAVIGFLNDMIERVQSAINTVIEGINSALSISIPDVRIGNPLAGEPLVTTDYSNPAWQWSANIPTVNWGRPIPLLANGGVVKNGGHAIVGDAGYPEYLRVINGQAVVTPMRGAATAAAGGGTVNNNITINQLPGESSEQLAARVQRVLVRWDKQRKAVYST